MRRIAAILSLAAGLACSACQSGPDVVYTGTNVNAVEGEWIKDPAAEGTTRGVGRAEQTRTRSNRIDIPVHELVHVAVTSSARSVVRNSGYDARYVRTFVAGAWLNRYTESVGMANGYDSGSRFDALLSNASNTLYPALWAEETFNARMGGQGTRAYSAVEQPWTSAGSLPGAAGYSSTWAQAMKSESYAEADASRVGYGQSWGARLIGLHLWKYADRELVADSVIVT
jgi:hypothetical protein